MAARPLTRRALGGFGLAGGLMLAAGRATAAPLAEAPPGQLGFTIMRKGCVIGSHNLRFERTDDDMIVHINVDMRVGFGPITFFRYRHLGEERWHADRFVSLETHTDNDGEALHVQAQRVGDQVRVAATGLPPQTFPGDSLPLTHWNIACMHCRLFNPQNGKMLPETTVPRGPDTVKLANGSQVKATRYSLDGKTQIDDWYDDHGIWTALRATVADGSVLTYLRNV